MKKDVKSDLKVKNWQEPNWYEPSEERCKYLDIPGIPQRIWVTEEFYKTYKRDFWNEWKEKLLGARCRIKSEKGNFWKSCDGDCSICSHSKTGNTLSRDYFLSDIGLEFPDESVDIVRDICIEKREYIHSKLQKKSNRKKFVKIFIKKIMNFISAIIDFHDCFSLLIKLIQFIIKHWF